LFESDRLAGSKPVGKRGSECHATSWKVGGGSSPLQTSHIAVEVVLVSGNGTRIGVLPEGVVTPSIRQSADAASIAGDPQWAVRGERAAVAGTRLPPIGGGVDHRVTTSTGMVGVGEIADPADHRSSAQAIASGARWVICPPNSVQLVNLGGGRNVIRTFDVEGTWEGNTIALPAPTVGGEKLCLSSARGLVRNGKVVGASNETSVGGASVLGRELRVFVGWNELSAPCTTSISPPLLVPWVALM
jgi:hypothetical protein